MKVALVGWDIDLGAVDALAGLGAEVTAFTRWHEGTSRRETGRGWVLRRCPHQIGSGLEAEGWSFRTSVLSGLDQEPGFSGGAFDVVHSLDPLTRAAADGLIEHTPTAARVTTIGLTDVLGVTAIGNVDRCVADHPWLFEHWRGAVAPTLVPRLSAFRIEGERSPRATLENGPLLAIWVKATAAVDPATVAAALSKARGSPGYVGGCSGRESIGGRTEA